MPNTVSVGLQVRLESVGGRLRVVLAGTLDASAASRIRSQLKPALHEGACNLVFDLAEVSYADRPGIDALIHAARVAHRLGGRVTLRDCPTDILRQLAALGHDRLFQYEPPSIEALASPSPSLCENG